MIIQRLKSIRKNKGMTQEQVATGLGISAKAYSKIETGVNQLEFFHIIPLSRLFGISSLDLLFELHPSFKNEPPDNKQSFPFIKNMISEYIGIPASDERLSLIFHEIQTLKTETERSANVENDKVHKTDDDNPMRLQYVNYGDAVPVYEQHSLLFTVIFSAAVFFILNAVTDAPFPHLLMFLSSIILSSVLMFEWGAVPILSGEFLLVLLGTLGMSAFAQCFQLSDSFIDFTFSFLLICSGFPVYLLILNTIFKMFLVRPISMVGYGISLIGAAIIVGIGWHTILHFQISMFL